MTDHKHGSGVFGEKDAVELGDLSGRQFGDPDVEEKHELEEIPLTSSKPKKKQEPKPTSKPKKERRKKEKRRDKAKNAGDESFDDSDEERIHMVEQAYVEQAKEKIKQENSSQTTRFRYHIGGLALKMIGKRGGISGIFLELEIGGLMKEVKSSESNEKKVEKESGDGQKKEVTVAVPRLENLIIRKTHKRYFTRLMKVEGTVDDELIFKFGAQQVSGVWTGTYNDLAEETLTVRVWHTSSSWNPNILMGTAEIPLVKVANSQVDREMMICQYTESRSARAEALAMLTFKFELEELFSFKLVFSKWKIELDDDETVEPEGCLACCVGNDPLVLGFEMANTKALCGINGCIEYQDLKLPRPLSAICCCLPTPWVTANTHYWTEKHKYTNIYSGGDNTDDVNEGQYMEYYGTRSNLEDETLSISIWKGFFAFGFGRGCADSFWSRGCCTAVHGQKVGKGREILQGKLDYGYVILYDTPIEKRASGLPMKWFWNGMTANARNIKGVVETLNEPRYRQLGNVGRPTGGNKWFRFDKKTLYLCVCIVRAKGLVSLMEYRESLNPCVTVDWAQIRREIDRKEDNPDPYWNETVYFKVRFDEKKKFDPQNLRLKDMERWIGSKIVVNVWDSNGFSKSPLGYCELDFDTIFENRKPRLMDNMNSARGGKINRYVYHTKQKLKSPVLKEDPDEKSNVHHSSSESRHVEILAYFELGNGARVGPSRKKRGKEKKKTKAEEARGKKLIRDEKIPPERLERARAFWIQALDSVPEVQKRTFAFCGIDEYSGNTYYLPSFLSVMVPPAEIRTRTDLLYYVFSIELTLRKSGGHYAQARKKQEVLKEIAPGLRIWSDPWFFLDKRRGDHRDHAILLCNFLLGFKENAFVCVGKARDADGVERDHVWVITLEDEQSDGFYSSVRFWETSSGETFLRMNHRIAERPKEDLKPLSLQNDGEYIEQTLNLTIGDDVDGIDSDDEGYSIKHSKELSNISALRERKRFQLQLRKSVKVEKDDEEEKKWRSTYEKKAGQAFHRFKVTQDSTPYSSLDVVFNNTNLYANLQTPNPELISFDFNNKLGWRSFKGRETDEKGRTLDDGQKYFCEGQIRQFYPDKTMAGAKAQEQVVMVKELELINIIRGAIQGFREFGSRPCMFLSKFAFQDQLAGDQNKAVDYIRKRLVSESKYGERCSNLLYLENAKKYQRSADQKDAEVKEAVTNIDIIRKVWRQEILESLGSDRTYAECMFNFKHADSSRISDSVVERMESEARKLLQIPESQKPRFAVGALIDRLPGMISPVRVLVCVTYLTEVLAAAE